MNIHQKTKTGQRKHDKAVLRSAQWYDKQKYKVRVDLPECNKPKKIKGYIPDLIVKKGKKEIVVEIETKGSNGKDKEQQEAFREYCERKKERKFRKKII